MTIYLDNEFKCHIDNDGSMIAADVEFFDGKCREFIEGYRHIPVGMTWTRQDGVAFRGEMTAPWKDYSLLEAAQKMYEQSHKISNAEADIAAMADALFIAFGGEGI